MNNIEEQLRDYYAGWPDDLDAQRRLTELVQRPTVRSRRTASGPLFAAVVSAAVIALLAVSAAVWGGAAQSPRRSSDAAASASADRVRVTAQAAVGTLISLLPRAGRVTDLGGGVNTGCVGGHFTYARAGRSTRFEVTIGIPHNGLPTQHCGLPPANAKLTVFSSTNSGGRLAVTSAYGESEAVWSVFLLRADHVFVGVLEIASRTNPQLSRDDVIELVQSLRWQSRVPASVAHRYQDLFQPVLR